jgi:hypothetical protein
MLPSLYLLVLLTQFKINAIAMGRRNMEMMEIRDDACSKVAIEPTTLPKKARPIQILKVLPSGETSPEST